MLSHLAIAVAVFASTNLDDILLLSAFFSDTRLRRPNIAAGQFLGIGVLVLASAVAALLAVSIPAGWVALLGLVPLGLGLHRLAARERSSHASPEAEERRSRDSERSMERRTHSQVLAVAGVTVANGGDNLGAYIPLFASARAAMPLYVATFAVMTAVWCLIARALVNNRLVGEQVRRIGRKALPFVLIALGLYILGGVRRLF